MPRLGDRRADSIRSSKIDNEVGVVAHRVHPGDGEVVANTGRKENLAMVIERMNSFLNLNNCVICKVITADKVAEVEK